MHAPPQEVFRCVVSRGKSSVGPALRGAHGRVAAQFISPAKADSPSGEDATALHRFDFEHRDADASPQV